ncbi:FAD-dependent oxidoreductase [Stenotrophomonas maltophilia]|uniref:FAD-dependent oxidoreductase n=1 Tax=Stenotrophomonas maltophilia TaxID=40324 RepID=UPI0021C8606D|nr:FAD-dependent oxidoreductase [Stenotrophomonas maltophilia]MCU1159798.1 FAD-dependent oxidoreductase [Stenotrophomonas maltophilia]
MSAEISVVDCLGLLASKVAPNVFDLSSGQYHVSLRDQIVRGRLLVGDIISMDPDFSSLLVVGGGVAGLAVAVAAADAGKQVVVLEKSRYPLSKQVGVHSRFVGPFMYEWPWKFSRSQVYPPVDATCWPKFTGCPTLTAPDPISAAEFAKQVGLWFNAALAAHPRLHLAVKLSASLQDRVRAYLKKGFSNAGMLDLTDMNWHRDSVPLVSIKPAYIILAAGMGAENCSLPEHDGKKIVRGRLFRGTPFWENDRLRECADSGHDVVVVGGGDGALQDALRALTSDEHPLQTLRKLECCPVVKANLEGIGDRLQTIELQGRLMASWRWNPAVFESVDSLCSEVARKIAKKRRVRAAVLKVLRPRKASGSQKVTLLVKSDYFDKAYLLNRFLVHLIRHVLKIAHSMGEAHDRIALDVVFNAAVEGVQSRSANRFTVHYRGDHGRGTVDAAYVAVRFGVDKKTIPGLQMVHLSGDDQKQRTSLSRVPLPYAV